jgi:hypothetical protein
VPRLPFVVSSSPKVEARLARCRSLLDRAPAWSTGTRSSRPGMVRPCSRDVASV